MIHMVDPRQNRLFDPFQGVIPPAGQRIIAEGWQGVFRHALLEVMPVGELAENFSRELGAPTKELYSMAGLVFLADFFGWTAQEAVEVYIFRSDVQYALNLEPGVTVSTRSVERYQKMFRDDELAISVFQDVTTRLAEKLELDITCQRLDSTHVFSHMASFGRTKLMAVAIKRFLTQVRRHDHELYTALPEEFRRRYEPAESQLFSAAKDAESRQRSRQQAAEDLLWVIERFANCADMTGRSTYKALVTIFSQQCEVSAGKVVVKAKTGGDCMQNPSDPTATYDAHKGQGYQVQIAETCSPENEVQLITGALPQSAAEPDGGAVVPMLDQLTESKLLPEAMLADTLYGGDENVQAAETRGVELVCANPRLRAGNRPRGPDARRLRHGRTDRTCGNLSAGTRAAGGRAGQGSGHDADRDGAGGLRGMPLPQRVSDPQDSRRPLYLGIHRQGPSPGWAAAGTRDPGVYGAVRAMLGHRVDQQRLEESAGIEAVEGAGSRQRVPCDSAQSGRLERAAGGGGEKMCAWVSGQVAQTLKGGESGPNERLCALVLRRWDDFQTVFGGSHGRPHDFGGSLAA